MRSTSRTIPVAAILVIELGALLALTRGSGLPPVFGRPGPLDGSLEETALALGRWSLLALGAWFLLAAIAYVAATATGRTDAAQRIGRLTPPGLRRIADRCAAGVLSLLILLGSAGPAIAAEDDGRAPTSPLQRPGPIPHPGIERLAGSPGPATPAPAPHRGATHVVVRGDNLWKIAAAHLDRIRASVSTRDYWLLLLEANREQIRSGDPDLIFPGEVIELPPVPEPG